MKKEINNFKSIDEMLEKFFGWELEFQVFWLNEETLDYYCDDEYAYYDSIDEIFKEYGTENYNLEAFICSPVAKTFIDEEEKTIIIDYYEQ